MLSVQNLSFDYGNDSVIYKSLNIDFETASIHGIVGLNGSGKSTLFNLIAQNLKPTEGKIILNNKPLHYSHIGYLETSNFFYPYITGQEYLNLFSISNTGFNLNQLNSIFQLPLQELIENYSTGMKKKLALLAMLMEDKPVYILDEPFNGLDLESNKIVEQIVISLQAKGKIILISSHILSPLLNICFKIHHLQSGGKFISYDKNNFNYLNDNLFNDIQDKIDLVKNSI